MAYICPVNRNYEDVQRSIKGVLMGEPDLVANLSNVSAILKELPGYFWVGFYLVKNDELVLGPFQGPVACTRIQHGKGVCGTAWSENETQLVPDVHAFPGHIACSPHSKSEVVVPVRDKSGKVVMVLDIDSDQLDAFNDHDVEALEGIAQHLTETQNFSI